MTNRRMRWTEGEVETRRRGKGRIEMEQDEKRWKEEKKQILTYKLTCKKSCGLTILLKL